MDGWMDGWIEIELEITNKQRILVISSNFSNF